MKHIVCYSGGEASALVAENVARRHGTENTLLVNHDISSWTEHADIKRFKREVAARLDLPVIQVNIGGEEDPSRIPDQFDVCVQARAFKVGTATELCSNRLKTAPFHDWLARTFPDPSQVTCYYGFEAGETARMERRRRVLGSMGYGVGFPLAAPDAPQGGIAHVLGVAPPVTYAAGWKHANCAGCLKAGKQHWFKVFCERPDVWDKAKWAEREIGYTIHRGEPLTGLESSFTAMCAAGVPTTESLPSGQFWATARRLLETARPLGGLFDDVEGGRTCV